MFKPVSSTMSDFLLAPDTPGHQLVELSQRRWDTATRQAIARHPNTPRDVVAQLISQYPSQVVLNPSLPLFLLEDPGWFQKLGEYRLTKLAQQPQAFPMLVGWLMRMSDPRLRSCAAFCPALDNATIHELVHDDAELTRVRIARHTSLDGDHIHALANDNTSQVRAVIAIHPDLDVELIDLLASDADHNVRRAIATRKTLPTDILERLCSDENISVRGAIITHQETLPERLIDILVEDPRTHPMLAKHPSTPMSYLRYLASEAEPKQASGTTLTATLRLPRGEFQRSLHRSRKPRDWAAIVKTGRVPLEHLQFLAAQSSANYLHREIIKGHACSPSLFLSLYYTNANYDSWLTSPGGPRR